MFTNISIFCPGGKNHDCIFVCFLTLGVMQLLSEFSSRKSLLAIDYWFYLSDFFYQAD
jgi:hypothetical protein